MSLELTLTSAVRPWIPDVPDMVGTRKYGSTTQFQPAGDVAAGLGAAVAVGS